MAKINKYWGLVAVGALTAAAAGAIAALVSRRSVCEEDFEDDFEDLDDFKDDEKKEEKEEKKEKEVYKTKEKKETGIRTVKRTVIPENSEKWKPNALFFAGSGLCILITILYEILI